MANLQNAVRFVVEKITEKYIEVLLMVVIGGVSAFGGAKAVTSAVDFERAERAIKTIEKTEKEIQSKHEAFLTAIKQHEKVPDELEAVQTHITLIDDRLEILTDSVISSASAMQNALQNYMSHSSHQERKFLEGIQAISASTESNRAKLKSIETALDDALKYASLVAMSNIRLVRSVNGASPVYSVEQLAKNAFDVCELQNQISKQTVDCCRVSSAYLETDRKAQPSLIKADSIAAKCSSENLVSSTQ